MHNSFVLAVIGAEKCVRWTYVVFSSFFRVKPKDIASDKTCKQQTWLLESLLQSEANGKRVWSFLLEAGFGKLASKVVLPQGAEVVMKHLESLLQNFCSRRGFGPSRRRGSLLCFKVIVAKKCWTFFKGQRYS